MTNPVTSVSYTGDGTTTSFAVPFDYLQRSDVVVSVNGVDITSHTWTSPGVISISPAPTSGYSVFIRRVTGLNPYVTFQSGAVRSTDLNKAAKQPMFLHQEYKGVYAFDGAYASLSGKPTLFNGTYAALTGKPTLFDGTWASLSGKPSFATVATTGQYSDLIGSPTQRVYDLRAMGCPTDGVSDCRPVFMTAYNAAKVAGGGCILLPQGRLVFSTTVTIDCPNISIFGAGAGATRWCLTDKNASFIDFQGADVHSIDIGYIQFESADFTAQTAGGVFSFKLYGGSAGCLDVKLHHFTTFHSYHGITTAYSSHIGATVFLDVIATDFEMRDCHAAGISLSMMAGFKASNFAIGYADPQGTQPPAGSTCLYFGDWVDGYWISNGNVLGGETSVDFGSDWSSGGRKPSQGQCFGLSADSGWLSSVRIRACMSIEFYGLIVGDLAGGTSPGLLIGGSGSTFTASEGVEYAHFHGGKLLNNYGHGLTLAAPSREVHFRGTVFMSNGRAANATYHNAYVSPSLTRFSFVSCVFGWSAWFGSEKPAYALFIDSGCDDYMLVANRYNPGDHATGGLFNGSSGAATQQIVANM